MDRVTHRQILAEMYECQENQLLSRYDNMMPQIRNDAIVTLSIDKRVEAKVKTAVFA